MAELNEFGRQFLAFLGHAPHFYRVISASV